MVDSFSQIGEIGQDRQVWSTLRFELGSPDLHPTSVTITPPIKLILKVSVSLNSDHQAESIYPILRYYVYLIKVKLKLKY